MFTNVFTVFAKRKQSEDMAYIIPQKPTLCENERPFIDFLYPTKIEMFCECDNMIRQFWPIKRCKIGNLASALCLCGWKSNKYKNASNDYQQQNYRNFLCN